MGIGCFGVCVAQTRTYLKSNNDTRLLQAIVAVLFALVFACTVLNGQILHFYFLKNFGNYIGVTYIAQYVLLNPHGQSQINPILREISAFTLITLLVTFIADICFASRVWRLRRVHISITALIVLTALAALISGVLFVDEILKVPLIVTLMNKKHRTAVAVINITAAMSQMIATLALWYSFKTHMSETSMPQLVFQRLSFSVVIRGTILTIAQLLIMILYLVRPDRMWWAPIRQVLAPMYYMTTIATLNIRGQSTVQAQTEFSTIPKPNRCDSIFCTQLSHTSPTAGSLAPFAGQQCSSRNADLRATDSGTSESHDIPQAAFDYKHRNDLQASQELTSRPITNEISNLSTYGTYPTLDPTLLHSKSNMGLSPAPPMSSAKVRLGTDILAEEDEDLIVFYA
ncbi:hypothetical protein PM082_024864 [Marasmius tenuissimus]|nr:hypothetical protein PM082_024864 [Marasmius tenuissimus]